MIAPVSFSFFRLLLSFSSERKGKKWASIKHKELLKKNKQIYSNKKLILKSK
jgi:hypothetical protein